MVSARDAVTFKLALLMWRLCRMIWWALLMALKRKRTRGHIKGWIQLAVHRKCQYTFLSSISLTISFTISSNIYTAQVQILQRTAYIKGCEIREGISDDRLRDPFIISVSSPRKREARKVMNKAFIIHNEIPQYAVKRHL